MPIHIIIDGYNLIRQSPDLSRIDHADLQAGREALVTLLATYKKVKPHRITVVFDGTRAPGLTLERDRQKGIAIVFSRQGETADSVIKRMAAREREGALVVSSDRDVTAYAQSRGAAVMDSPAFEQKLLLAGYLNGCFWEGESGLDPDFFEFFNTDASVEFDASTGDGGSGIDADSIDFIDIDATLEQDVSVEDSGSEPNDSGSGMDTNSVDSNNTDARPGFDELT